MKTVSLILFTLISFWFTQYTHAQNTLPLNGTIQGVSYSGSAETWVIPSNIGGYDHIEFTLRGADGGRRRVPAANCRKKGGEGALVVARFALGPQAGALKPGGTIRFVVGEKGDSHNGSGERGAGGAGGTGILYLDPGGTHSTGLDYPSLNLNDAATSWVLLAVAGGGGGAGSDGICNGSPGKGGRDITNGGSGSGVKGGAGGSLGAGGIGAEDNDGTLIGGSGGGYKGDGIVARRGGLSGSSFRDNLGRSSGGFGYGGGGSGDEGGGGGGGFSGGGGGDENRPGGGGGSFVNAASTYSQLTKGGARSDPKHGAILFQFKDLGGNRPTAICQNLTLNLDANGEASLIASDMDNGSSDIFGSTLSFFIPISSNNLVSARTLSCGDEGFYPLIVQNQFDPSDCVSFITLEDHIPPIALCKDITLLTDASGQASTVATDLNHGSSDNCTAPIDLSFLASQTQFSCSLVPVPVTLEVSDAEGNTATCTSQVTLEDKVSPMAHCQDMTLYLDAGGQATLVPSDLDNGSSDNCEAPMDLIFSASQTQFSCSQTPVPVTLEASDLSGNTATCMSHITLEDTVPPVVQCQHITVNLNTSGIALSIVNYSSLVNASDNCGSIRILNFPGFINVNCSDVGIIPVVITVQEDPGLLKTTCTATITVRENKAPVAKCHAATVYLDASGSVEVMPSDIDNGSSDNCGIDQYSVSPNAFDCSDIGSPHAVSLTVTDGSNNAHSCTTTVTILDSTPPDLSCPANQTLYTGNIGCSATYAIPNPISDACSGASWGASFSGNANGIPSNISGIADGSSSGTLTFELGTTIVSLNSSDAAGNTANACSFTVTVEDNSSPAVSCPPNQVVKTNDNDCMAQYAISDPLSDNCSGATWGASFSGNPFGNPSAISGIGDENNSGPITFEQGTTTITLNGTDASNNTATPCSFSITVNDSTPPVAICPANTTIPNDVGVCYAVHSFIVSSSDNCRRNLSENLTGIYPVGETTIAKMVVDIAGNTATCSFKVTVIDAEAPTISCPADISLGNDPGQCDAIVNYSITSDDNCLGQSTVLTAGIGSGSIFPVGTTTETYTVTDAAGNTASCSFTITINDEVPPIFDCPTTNVVRNTDAGVCDHLAVGNDLDPLVSDNCSIQTLTNDYNQSNSLDGAVFPKGKTLVTWTATDLSGNSATCSYHVKIRDKEAPIFDNCPDDTTITIPFNTGGSYHTWTALTATDNCNNPNQLIITGFPLSGSYFSVGTMAVNWTATDKRNNTSHCDFDVTVVEQGAPAPSGWANGGVGSNNTCATNYDAATGSLSIVTSGGNISGTSDQFCGITLPNSDHLIDFRARVTPPGTGYFDQAGIMMRQSLNGNAACASMYLTGTSVPVMSLRPSAGSMPLSTPGTAVTTPYWVRLYRFGGAIQGYISADGVNWTLVKSYPNVLSSPLYLVLFAKTSGTQGTATIDNISINGTAARMSLMNEETALSLEAYPNPFSEDLFIKVANALPGETYDVRLSNMMGQRVYGYKTGASAAGTIDQRISLEHLSAGTYLLEVSAGVQRQTLKVVKQ